MPKINLSFEGLPEVQKEFKRQSKEYLPFFGKVEPKVFFEQEVAPFIVNEIKVIFRKEGIGRGGKWPALNPRYKEWKTRHSTSRSSKMLRLHDTYFKAATRADAPGSYFDINNDRMILGVDPDYFQGKTGVPYPLFLEEGTTQMPARPIYSQIPRIPDLEQRLAARIHQAFFSRAERNTRQVSRFDFSRR